ncbi:acetyl-CoA C-acetyltransferase, partial [Micromonospora sp. b486]|nr:acetyl-CoA C-acetyltransferase [Micromonospora sp. b486]
VVVEAVRTPIGRRRARSAASTARFPARHVLLAVLERTGVAPADVDQIIGGCVTQVGEQGLNVTRKRVAVDRP